jgi:hypothetical protein
MQKSMLLGEPFCPVEVDVNRACRQQAKAGIQRFHDSLACKTLLYPLCIGRIPGLEPRNHHAHSKLTFT